MNRETYKAIQAAVLQSIVPATDMERAYALALAGALCWDLPDTHLPNTPAFGLRNPARVEQIAAKIREIVAQHKATRTLRPALARFAQRMEAALAAHDVDRGPEGWREASEHELWMWLGGYQVKLDQALADRNAEEIQHQAVNVANLAMMIADVTQERAGDE